MKRELVYVGSTGLEKLLRLKLNNYEWLHSLMGNRAIDKKVNRCLRCGYCCAVKPCIPTPEELEKIAKYFKLSLRECVLKYFVLDKVKLNTRSIVFVLPARTSQSDMLGTLLPWERTWDIGYCIFFKEGRCTIYPVRPSMAKEFECWNRDTYVLDNNQDKSILAWKDINIEEYLGIEVHDII